jgi:hypothetical protein
MHTELMGICRTHKNRGFKAGQLDNGIGNTLVSHASAETLVTERPYLRCMARTCVTS